MKHPKLDVEARKVLGKQVRKLRREGILPANIYGKELKSTAVQLPTKAFTEVYEQVGETGLIDVMLGGERRPSLVKNIHWNYRTNEPLHVDFYQVNLKEKVRAMVPLTIVGEAKAVADNVGLMLQQLNEVEVEALPEGLPEEIEVNVEGLAAVDDSITVEDLKAPTGVTILTDPAQTIVKIDELVVEEPEPTEEEAAPGEVPVVGEEEKAGETSEAAEEKGE